MLFAVNVCVLQALVACVIYDTVRPVFVFLQLVALMATRKALDFVFTQRDLYWLDHLLPDESRRKKEDSNSLEQKIEQAGLN